VWSTASGVGEGVAVDDGEGRVVGVAVGASVGVAEGSGVSDGAPVNEGMSLVEAVGCCVVLGVTLGCPGVVAGEIHALISTSSATAVEAAIRCRRML
jgi:hypothetical protein